MESPKIMIEVTNHSMLKCDLGCPSWFLPTCKVVCSFVEILVKMQYTYRIMDLFSPYMTCIEYLMYLYIESQKYKIANILIFN